jgi:hypothetical protein
VYVAGAALGVDATFSADGTHLEAGRMFGPVGYRVLHIARNALAEWQHKIELGDAALAAERAQDTGQDGADR